MIPISTFTFLLIEDGSISTWIFFEPGENASVRDYLVAARSALLLGRTGEAQQALEMAETRALDRSVPLFQTNVVDKSPLVGEIGQALQALGGGDRGRAVQIIEAALPHVN